MGNSAKRDARKADLAERKRKALELRKAGATYEQIAKQLGVNRGNVWKYVTDAIQDIYREPAQDVLQLELQRLDVMLLGLWSKAKAGDVSAVDRVLRIQERRAAFLGLDAPKRNEHTGKDGGPIPVAAFDLSNLTDAQLDRILAGDLGAIAERDPGDAEDAGEG